MLRLIIKYISIILTLCIKIIVLGLPVLLTPLMILYATHLNAQNLKPVKNNPDFITIPMPVKSINRGTVISESDLSLVDTAPSMANVSIAQDMMQLVGQEARRTLYKNKPILLRDIGAVTIIRRNDTVTMQYKNGTMLLQTVGRAMQDGGVGDTIKVMNEHSKKIVTGRISKNGEVDVAL
jgi:flagella basal body P-ring formation protein FlgA